MVWISYKQYQIIISLERIDSFEKIQKDIEDAAKVREIEAKKSAERKKREEERNKREEELRPRARYLVPVTENDIRPKRFKFPDKER